MENFMEIYDLIDLKMMQNILDHFAKATDLSFVTVDHKGNPVTRYSGFTNFCDKLRNFEEYKKRCYKCDEYGGIKAAITGKPYFYICHTGLLDFAIPIMIKGKYLGAVLSGQVKVEENRKKELDLILSQTNGWECNLELKNAYDEIPEVPFDKISSTAYTLHEMSKYIVEKEYINIAKEKLNNKYMKQMEEQKKRIELEKSLKESELKALQYQINPHFLFNALNTICRLAYIEKAEKTEEIGYAFSEMMRYVLKKNNSQLIKIKDEMTHSNNYFKIQKIRLGERLSYSIDIPEKYNNVECPFMILQPLIENSVKYVVEVRVTGGNIKVKGYDDDKDLIITIEDDGDGIPEEKIKELLSMNGSNINQKNISKESIGISNVNKRLIHFFGNEYGLEIISPNKVEAGTVIKIKIPLKGTPNLL
ncbi:PocR ligand-binding domain-containing protein [Tissierella sp. MSJ-40]|uniref:PocR ligand-binding domain-containing protein n=1 Tax=Tissierella simiarum TaxID=2841534 RepID=A0ABS6E414_9FIRM|nr:PocR ligand-binding domain-containing protein [Tissierella simiarum]MBU5437524.1 PocR ligand-binding domain-containing protein [Tissierella simiarum]